MYILESIKHQIEVDVIPKIRQEFKTRRDRIKDQRSGREQKKEKREKNDLNERREKQRTKRRW